MRPGGERVLFAPELGTFHKSEPTGPADSPRLLLDHVGLTPPSPAPDDPDFIGKDDQDDVRLLASLPAPGLVDFPSVVMT